VTLKMIVQPEKRREIIETIQGMLEPTRVERGCLSYRLYEDVENKNALVLLEEWATQEDLEKHISKDKLRLLSLLNLLSEQPKFQFNTVSHTAGIELIEDVLSKAR